MKIKLNKNAERLNVIRRYLCGRMSDVEEKSFFEQIKTDLELRRQAAAEALLCKNYIIAQNVENEKIVDCLKKMNDFCLPFEENRDNSSND